MLIGVIAFLLDCYPLVRPYSSSAAASGRHLKYPEDARRELAKGIRVLPIVSFALDSRFTA